MNPVAFYDTKPYDREYFERAPEAHRLRRQFHEFRLTSETAASVDGAQAVCVVVNDRLDAPCLQQLHHFSLSGLVGFDLHGKTAGVVGTGKIGKIAARIFRGFGTEVLAFDPNPSPAWAAALGVRYPDFDMLLANSNIVSLHLPLTPSLRHLLNAGTFARLKPGPYLLNTHEALSEIARVTTTNLVRLETGEAFLAGTTL